MFVFFHKQEGVNGVFRQAILAAFSDKIKCIKKLIDHFYLAFDYVLVKGYQVGQFIFSKVLDIGIWIQSI